MFLSGLSIGFTALILYYFGTALIIEAPLVPTTPTISNTTVSKQVPAAEAVEWRQYRSQLHTFTFEYKSNWVFQNVSQDQPNTLGAEIIEAVSYVEKQTNKPIIQFYLTTVPEQQISSFIADCDTSESACETINGVEFYKLSIPGLEASNTFITIKDDKMYTILVDSTLISPSDQETIINSFSL